MHSIGSKLHVLQRTKAAIDRTCSTCSKMQPAVTEVQCVSLDCPYTYQKAKLSKDLEDTDLTLRYFANLVDGEHNQEAQVRDAWTPVEIEDEHE